VRRPRLAAWLLAALFWAGLHAAAVAADKAPCRPMTFEGDGFVVCRYAPDADEIRLVNRGPDGPVSSLEALQALLRADAGRVAFAMNAGMYDVARKPLGLFVQSGRTVHRLNRRTGGGNFYLAPNGVFWIDSRGKPHIDETGAYAARDPKAVWATQSGPLLVQAGAFNPQITPNGTSLAVRNGVGVRADGEALFVISNDPVSFGRFARLLRDGLGCPDALFLDGAVSSLWAPNLGRQDGRDGLGTFVVVLSKRP
jgi:uncharacterized protein YigE (DUF2233 family)